MPIGSLVWRATAAILLTGTVSALVIALGTAFAFSLKDSRGPDLQFIAMIWFFGSIFAGAAAAIIGVFFELPKAAWLARHDYGLCLHLFLSVLAAIFSLSIFVLLTGGHEVSRVTSGESSWLYPCAAFLVGGVCSGAFWWKLVVIPWRYSLTT